MTHTFLPSFRPLVHGHRGCRGLRPENTLAAFIYALRLGVDVLELDVVVSADRLVVVSHEPWFSSTICLDSTGQPIAPAEERQHNLYQLPYASIRQYDCGSLRHPDFPEQMSQPAFKPLLRDVLALVEAETVRLGRAPVGYSVEVKSEPAGDDIFHPRPATFLPLVLAELQAAQVMERTTLLSFDSRILRLAHQLKLPLATSLLVEDTGSLVLAVQSLGFVPTALGPDRVLVTPESLAELRNLFPDLQLVVWTVNEPRDMQLLLNWGVNGITTDYPDRLLSLLRLH